MFNFKKTIGFLMISVYVLALSFQNIAHAVPIAYAVENTPVVNEAIFDSLELTNAVGTYKNPIGMVLHATGIKKATVYYLQKENNENGDRGRIIELEQRDGQWIGTVQVIQDSIRGEYILSRIELTDLNDQIIEYYNQDYAPRSINATPKDFSDCNFEIKGAYGEFNGVFESLEITNAVGTPENPISALLHATGIKSATAYFLLLVDGNVGDRGTMIEFNQIDNQWIGTRVVYQENLRGKYILSRLQLVDNNDNMIMYYNQDHLIEDQDALPKDFAGINIETSGVYGGFNPKVTIEVEDIDLQMNETLKAKVEVDQNEVNINAVVLYYQLEGTDYSVELYLQKNSEGKFVGEREISEYHKEGTFILNSIMFLDGSDEYMTEIRNGIKSPGSYDVVQDFSNGNFSVVGTKVDLTAPKFISLDKEQIEVVIGQNNEINATVIEDESLLNYGSINLKNENGIEAYGRISYRDGKTIISMYTNPLYNEPGVYFIDSIYLVDNSGNSSLYLNKSTVNENSESGIIMDLSQYVLTFKTKADVVPELVSLKIKTLPQVTYYKGEDINIANLVVEGEYDNEGKVILEITDENITGYDQNLIGDQTITITYGEVKTTFKVTVVDPIEKVVVNSNDNKIINFVISSEDFKLIEIPEVLDEDVESVKIELKYVLLDEKTMGDIELNLDESKSLIGLYNISLVKVIEKTDGTIIEKDLLGETFEGIITLVIKVPEEYKEKQNLVVVYVSDDGKLEELKTESNIINGVRYLSFETNHFSLYGILETTIVHVDEEVVVENPETVEPIGTPEVEETNEPTVTPEVEVNNNPTVLPDIEETVEESLPKAGSINEDTFLFSGLILISIGMLIFSKRSKKLVIKE